MYSYLYEELAKKLLIARYKRQIIQVKEKNPGTEPKLAERWHISPTKLSLHTQDRVHACPAHRYFNCDGLWVLAYFTFLPLDAMMMIALCSNHIIKGHCTSHCFDIFGGDRLIVRSQWSYVEVRSHFGLVWIAQILIYQLFLFFNYIYILDQFKASFILSFLEFTCRLDTVYCRLSSF